MSRRCRRGRATAPCWRRWSPTCSACARPTSRSSPKWTPRRTPGRSRRATIPAASPRRSPAPRISPPPACATSSPASPPRSSTSPPRTWSSPTAACDAAAIPTTLVPFARAGRHRATGRRPRCPTAIDQAMRETVFWTPPELTAPNDADEVNSSLCHGFIFDICAVEVDRITAAAAHRQLRHDARLRPHPAPRHGRRPDHRRLRPGARRRAA